MVLVLRDLIDLLFMPLNLGNTLAGQRVSSVASGGPDHGNGGGEEGGHVRVDSKTDGLTMWFIDCRSEDRSS